MKRTDKAPSSLFGILFIPAVIAGVLIIAAIMVISFRGGSKASTDSDNPRKLDQSTMTAFRTQYDALGVAVGRDNAPITIREFGDYQCPACGAFAPTARRIRQDLVQSGKARFIFFDFPLPMHAHAQQAAEAARCAARQDKFWPYHERLYETQDQWAATGDATSSFLDIAVETGLDADKLKQCLKQNKTDAVIAKEQNAGKAIRLRATPTVIVGDTLFSGVVSFDRIQQAVAEQSPSGRD